MPFSLTWNKDPLLPDTLSAVYGGLKFFTRESSGVRVGARTTCVLTSVNYEHRPAHNGQRVVEGFGATPLTSDMIPVKHGGFYATGDPLSPVEADVTGTSMKLSPGAFVSSVYVANQIHAKQIGAPVPPLVPGHVWVSGSSYDSGGRVITTWALDSPDDLSYNVLARPVLVNYAEMLNQWATEQRAKVTSGEPVTKL